MPGSRVLADVLPEIDPLHFDEANGKARVLNRRQLLSVISRRPPRVQP
jgi:hypothetical protein